jgi:hypothetical protein
MASKKNPTGRAPGRPKPKVLVEYAENGWDGLALLEAPVIYVILMGDPGVMVNIRQDYVSKSGSIHQHKYIRSTWTCRAHAERQCRRLSKYFKRSDLRVVALGPAGVVSD